MKQQSSESQAHSSSDAVDPDHYKGAGGLQAIDVIRAFGLNYELGNAVKYILRCGKKGGPQQAVEDLQKSRWYLQSEIERRCST